MTQPDEIDRRDLQFVSGLGPVSALIEISQNLPRCSCESPGDNHYTGHLSESWHLIYGWRQAVQHQDNMLVEICDVEDERIISILKDFKIIMIQLSPLTSSSDSCSDHRIGICFEFTEMDTTTTTCRPNSKD